MASLSFWFLSPSLAMAVIGKLRGGDRTVPTPAVNWRRSIVDVVVPAKDEERSIAAALSSLFRQDYPIRNVYVFDDGSTDQTSAITKRYSELCGREIKLVRRSQSIGKTPALREFCQKEDADAVVILDGDTILVSPDYISRLVEELFANAGVAAACGEVMPLTRKRRMEASAKDPHLLAVEIEFQIPPPAAESWWERMGVALTILYRTPMYVLLQRTLYDGTLKLFGAQANPVGCAVAYRTNRLRECFAYAAPRVGDNLSMSEDIYIGHFFNWKGWRNVQVIGVRCESTEPPITRLPRQLFLWSSGFLQSNYYFRELPLTPFKQIRDWFSCKTAQGAPDTYERRIQEQYRAAWGEAFTRRHGRPIGWMELVSLLEKIAYPLGLLYCALFRRDVFVLTVAAETLLCMGLVFATADRGTRFKYSAMLIPAIPVRLMSLCVDMFAVTRCFVDLAIDKREWRK
jgi:hypothetical protein